MNEPNPYTPPQSESVPPNGDGTALGGHDFKQLKKLYHRSSNVNVITFLLGLGLIFIVILSAIPDMGEDFPRFLLIGIAAFYAAAIVGLFKRTSWGRILGIIVCILSLVNIPIGTLIGAFGLFAFFGSPQLFGKDRLTHNELKAEFKLQKAALKKG